MPINHQGRLASPFKSTSLGSLDLSLSLSVVAEIASHSWSHFSIQNRILCMESLSRYLKELPTMVGSLLQMLEEQHRRLPAARLEGVINGDGGHGGHAGAIVDDVLAALPLLGRNHILPKVGESSAEISAN